MKFSFFLSKIDGIGSTGNAEFMSVRILAADAMFISSQFVEEGVEEGTHTTSYIQRQCEKWCVSLLPSYFAHTLFIIVKHCDDKPNFILKVLGKVYAFFVRLHDNIVENK